MKGEYQKLSERPIADILRDERSKEAVGKSKDEDSKKKPRWRDAAPPIIERPFRARKAIERFGCGPEKDSPRAEKEFQILQGSGTALKDIPNVAYKLSKISKADDILVLLHALLYGRRTKVNYLKANILGFSGYVWGENKEKERKKVRERLERFTREGLYQLIDLMDVQISKSSSKKEELVEEVFKFLLAPKITRDTILEKLEQKSKEELSKGTVRRGKRKKGAEKPDQKKVVKDKYAAKREKQDKTAEENVAKDVEQHFGKKRRRSKSQKGTVEEVQKSSKKAKKSLDMAKQKEDQHIVSKEKDEKDDVADDEELLKEEEQMKEQTDVHTKEDGGSKGDDASEEKVTAESLVIDEAEVERAEEGTDKEAPKDESGGKDDDKVVPENGLHKEVGIMIMKEDNEKTDENTLLNSEEKEHVPECRRSQEEEIKAEESSFMASVQEYNKETEKPFLGFSGEKENAEVVEQPDSEIELEGQDVCTFVLEHLEAGNGKKDERIYGEITGDIVEGAIEGHANSLAKSEVDVSDNKHADQRVHPEGGTEQA